MLANLRLLLYKINCSAVAPILNKFFIKVQINLQICKDCCIFAAKIVK